MPGFRALHISYPAPSASLVVTFAQLAGPSGGLKAVGPNVGPGTGLIRPTKLFGASMVRRPLTTAQVEALKENGTHWVASPGLYLQVKPNGARSWLFRYSTDGKV